MGQVTVERPLAEIIRELWGTWERQGLEAMLAAVPADVEWCPLAADGQTLRGSEELRAFWSRYEGQGKREQAVPYLFEEDGDCVLVSGSLRHFAPQGWSDSQPVWVFFFRAGLLRRAQGFRSREDALAAARAHNAQQA